MKKIKINQEFKEYLDNLCEEHMIKITKKNETEQAFNYLKQELINKILKSLEENMMTTNFTTTYSYREEKNIRYDYSNKIFENINEEYLEELCNQKGINIEKHTFYNEEKKFITITLSLIYNYIPSPAIPKIKKKTYHEI